MVFFEEVVGGLEAGDHAGGRVAAEGLAEQAG